MLITLIRTGGIIPIKKTADKVVSWTEEEFQRLLDAIKKDSDAGQTRDATEFQLKHNAGTLSIDWDKIPANYKNVFEELKDNLRVVKPG